MAAANLMKLGGQVGGQIPYNCAKFHRRSLLITGAMVDDVLPGQNVNFCKSGQLRPAVDIQGSD
jgi:hypothetical protein